MHKYRALLLLFGFVLSSLYVMAQTDCPEPKVTEHLNWCAGDHGFNEGATCGLKALAGTNISSLPDLVAQPILGNSWDRTNMMGAAKAAFKAGSVAQAVDAAICCQIHNPAAEACLEAHRQVVRDWLFDKTE